MTRETGHGAVRAREREPILAVRRDVDVRRAEAAQIVTIGAAWVALRVRICVARHALGRRRTHRHDAGRA